MTQQPNTKLAAPGPATTEDDEAGDRRDDEADHMDAMCRQWAAWCRTRRFFGPPPLDAGVLGKLTRKSRGKPSTGGPDAVLSPELAALNLAVAAQPMEGPRSVFELHYVHQVRDIKAAADQLGISRATWYRYLRDFRTKVFAAHTRILEANLAVAASLPSRGGPPRQAEEAVD